MQYQNPIVISPSEKHTATIIFLHGLGDSGYGWEDTMEELSQNFKNVKFILPHAPSRILVMRGGLRMNAWYDVKDLTKRGEEEFLHIEDTRQYIIDLIKKEINSGIDPSRIILGGFSQGAMTSYYTAYQLEFSLGGCIALSGYLPLFKSFETKLSKESIKTPLLVCHGEADSMIPINLAEISVDVMKKSGVSVNFHKYKGLSHSLSRAELEDIKKFIEERISSSKKEEL